MKQFLLSGLLIALVTGACAQNLVPNPSFEDIVQCPFTGGQVYLAQHWYVAENTPDYFNECATLAAFGVPSNIFGTRYPPTGVAYVGFCTFSTSTQPTGAPPYFREKIGVHLTEPLTVGTKYYCSYKLSASSRSQQIINGASNKTGFLFSTMKYDLDNLSPTINYCQVWTDTVIQDTVNWTSVKISFIADSAYTHLTVGNFFDNANTDTVRYWTSTNFYLQAYQYLDDVCVTTDSLGCVFIDNIQPNIDKTQLLVFPNPSDNYVTVRTSQPMNELTVCDAFGRTVFHRTNLQENKIDINTNQLPNGLYVLNVQAAAQTLKQKLVILHP